MQNNQLQSYDAIIIGTGQGGYPLAKELPKHGWKTAVIEKGPVGGTCVNTGCTPTKTMIASARVAYLAKKAEQYGVNTGKVSVNLKTVRERKRSIVKDFSQGSQEVLESTDGLDLIHGEASFINARTIKISFKDGQEKQITAEKIIINTGTQPRIPDLEGLNQVPYLDNATIMELDEVPRHLIVLGGGYVGLEFAQMFRRFGSAVTIIQRGSKLMGREDDDVADEVANFLQDEGIKIIFNAQAQKVQQNTPQNIELLINAPEGEQTITGSHLLVAVGRIPSTKALNLAQAGIETDERSYIKVNEKLETNVPGVWAIGDVKGGPAFTHVSYDDYRILKTNLLENGSAATTDRILPYTMYTDPQLGRVGLTETQARSQGMNIKVAKLPMTNVARAIEIAETRGFMKAVVDIENNQILGAAILGIEGGEIASLIQIAIMGKLPFTKLRDAMFAHPTLAEALNNLFAGI